MPLFDLPLHDLERYRPEVAEPQDFDDFWKQTLAEARAVPLGLRVERAETPLRQVDVDDVTFVGFSGHPIKAWYIRPAGVASPLPTVISYVGYSAGRGLPWDHTVFPAAGFAILRVDARGQGWTPGSPGHTADPVGHGSAVHPSGCRSTATTSTATTAGRSRWAASWSGCTSSSAEPQTRVSSSLCQLSVTYFVAQPSEE